MHLLLVGLGVTLLFLSACSFTQEAWLLRCRDEGSAALLNGYKAVFLKSGYSAANCVAIDAKARCQIGLRSEPIASFEFTSIDFRLERLCDLPPQGASLRIAV